MDGNPLLPLVEALSKFPGIGAKSAQRLAFFLLSLPEKEVVSIANAMVNTHRAISHCEKCFNISVTPVCHICSNPSRDETTVCVVAEPKDIFALEKTRDYNGVYHVLGGLLSPIDGINPESLRIQELLVRLRASEFTELIFAINPTIEGDATLLYLHSLLKHSTIPMTKLAYGLPVGADIDYADEMTLQKALSGRRKVEG